MNWSRTKTVFIMTFLLLNLFLGYQLYEVNDENQLSLISGNSTQDRLRENKISIDVELPDDLEEVEYLVGKKEKRNSTDIDALALNGQTAELKDEQTIVSTLDDPFPIGEERETLNQFLTAYVTNGDEYQFVREENNVIYLDQIFDELPVFTNQNEPLRLLVNTDNEVYAYEQEYWNFEKQGDPKDTLINLRAIETLFNQQYITMNQRVTDFQLGYYSFFKESRVFAPIMRIVVDKGEDLGEVTYLVNAFEGTVQEQGILDEEEESLDLDLVEPDEEREPDEEEMIED